MGTDERTLRRDKKVRNRQPGERERHLTKTLNIPQYVVCFLYSSEDLLKVSAHEFKAEPIHVFVCFPKPCLQAENGWQIGLEHGLGLPPCPGKNEGGMLRVYRVLTDYKFQIE